jgi:signal peptidase
MFRLLRSLGGAALWIGAALGVIAGLFWLASAAGLVQPLIVVSGSMEPSISTGDLLIATRADTATLEVGDVVSLTSELTNKLVTHRIISITPLDDERWEIEMKGDANPSEDAAAYVVGDQVWKPGPQLPGVGYTLSTLMRREFVLPALFALAALLGLSLLDPDDDKEEAGRDGDGSGKGDDSDQSDEANADHPDDADAAHTDDDALAALWPPPRTLETASP